MAGIVMVVDPAIAVATGVWSSSIPSPISAIYRLYVAPTLLDAVKLSTVAAAFPTLLGIFMFAYTLFSAGLTLPVLFGFWKDKLRLKAAGAAAAMLGGAAAVIATQLAGWHANLVVASGLGSSCALLFAFSLLTHRRGTCS